MLYEQAAPAVAPMLTTTSLAPQHSTSVFPVHESRDEFKSLSLRVNRTPQVRFCECNVSFIITMESRLVFIVILVKCYGILSV